MADGTAIEWTHRPGTKGETWNPIRARNKYKPGNEALIDIFLDEKVLLQPLRWKSPRTIFVCSMTDVAAQFVTDDMLDRIFTVAKWCPQHTLIFLTKRPARLRAYFEARTSGDPWAEAADNLADLVGMADHPAMLEPKDIPLPNVWLGTSAEDQKNANERIPDLLQTPAAVRFISAEPLLGPIDLEAICWMDEDAEIRANVLTAEAWVDNSMSAAAYSNECDGVTRLDWVIVGGESGPEARPMHPNWARDIRDQCDAASVAFFFKQWGAWRPTGSVDVYSHGPDKKLREFPSSPGIAWLADGRICLRDFSIAEHAKRVRTGVAYNARAVEVDLAALSAFCATLDDPSPGPDNPLGYQWMYRVGKKAAGRLLDGAEHSAFPHSPRMDA